MSFGPAPFASGRNRPSLVVMSGTEITNSTPLALISLMMLAPESPATERLAAALALDGIPDPLRSLPQMLTRGIRDGRGLPGATPLNAALRARRPPRSRGATACAPPR